MFEGYCHAQSARKHRKKGHAVYFAFHSVYGRPIYKWVVAY